MLDAHHHLWTYDPGEYPWIPKDSPLARDHLLPELESVTSSAGVSGTIVVQARQVNEESHDLLAMARTSELIRGVVGWVPLISENVRKDLEPLASEPKFVGVRHVLQDEADDYFLREDFHRGLSMLPGLGLRYDLLLFQRQLPVAIRLVDRQPDLGIIVDHLAKPEIRTGRIEPAWRSGMKELARRDNLLGVKFSGLATEFPDDQTVDPATVRAYFEETLEIFGSDRVMFGTDWPVCLLKTESYQTWVDLVVDLASTLSTDEKEAFFVRNGMTAYQLQS
jgi:L-fuconolactonase